MTSLRIYNSANNKTPGFENYLFCKSKKVLAFFIFMLVIRPLVIAQTIDLDALLTPEEIAWLNTNRHNIRYAPNPSWIPGDYMEDDVHKGIVSDYIKIFEQMLEVTFQRVYYQSWSDIIEGLKNSEVDFVGAIQQTTDRDAYLCFTQPFHKSKLGIVVRTNYEHPLTNEHIGTMRLACIENYASTEYVRQQFPNAEIVTCESDFRALISTSFAKTDGAVVDFMAASHIVNKQGITNLQFGKQLDFFWNLRLASIKQKPLLASILDKLLSTITEEQRKEIVSRWIRFDIISAPSFYERNKVLVWGAFIIIVSFILLAIIINLYLKKQVRSRTVELVVARNNAIRNEEAARDLFEKHAAVKLIIDPETGNIVDANGAAASFYGWTEEMLKEMNICQINTLPVDVIKKNFEKARTQQKTNFEFVHRKADGSLVDVEVFSSGVQIGNKQFLHSIIHDISEKKKAEQTIIYHSQMQSILRAIAANFINVPLELIDKEIQKSLEQIGNFVKIDRVYIFDYDWENYTCSNTFEWCNEGIEPQIDYLQKIPLDEIPQWVNPHKLGKALNIPDVLKLPAVDGVRNILEPQGILSLLTIPIMHNDLCVGFIGYDSVQKHHTFTENEVEFLSLFSQQFLYVKKRQNLETSLIYAKEKAEESDRLKSAFLANMSHEIRTPMNGILGFTELLLEPDLCSEKKERYIQIVNESGQRMLNTVNDIIEISRIEVGQIDVSVKETNFNKRVEELYHFFEPEAEKKGLKLILEKLLPDAEKNISTDVNKLDSILTNIIKNAIKYTETGSVQLGCQQKDHFIEFYIRDTGIGIPKTRQEAIFKRFEQADIADTRAFQGSGLGLAIAKSYVGILGGKIWVESEEAKGSTFFFTLPGNMRTENKTSTAHRIENEAKPITQNVSSLKVLIAEDDEASEMLISIEMEKFSKEILKASTGIEAIETCRKNPDIDLVLMDIQMPDLNGYEATREIRKFDEKVIIVAQTAYALTGDREKAIEAGCNDYISKPINKDELLALIEKYFGK